MMDIKKKRIETLVRKIGKKIPAKRPGRDIEYEEALFEHEAAVELMHKLTATGFGRQADYHKGENHLDM